MPLAFATPSVIPTTIGSASTVDRRRYQQIVFEYLRIAAQGTNALLTMIAAGSTIRPLPPIRQPGLAARITKAHTAPHRTPAFFFARNSSGVACRFLAGGARGAARLAGPWSGPASPHTVRHPFAVAGGDSTQRELSMETRYAFGGTGTLPGCFVRVGSVVPSSTRSTP
jgi:hypothetical protein